jgi:hypothetical protein
MKDSGLRVSLKEEFHGSWQRWMEGKCVRATMKNAYLGTRMSEINHYDNLFFVYAAANMSHKSNYSSFSSSIPRFILSVNFFFFLHSHFSYSLFVGNDVNSKADCHSRAWKITFLISLKESWWTIKANNETSRASILPVRQCLGKRRTRRKKF